MSSPNQFTSSLKLPWLHVNAQVRRLFGTGGAPDKAEWFEGSIYHIRRDVKINPYNAVKIVWLIQEKDTDDWVYDYIQTDNDNSPWDLELSHFVLEENMRPPRLPKSLKVGNLTAEAILNHIEELDFSYIFKIPVSGVQEFTDKFPAETDQLDLPAIRQLQGQGHYDSRVANAGIIALFSDLQRMIDNAKMFNNCNREFQVWRCAEMTSCALIDLRAELASIHGIDELLQVVEDAHVNEVTTVQEQIEEL